MEVWRPRAKTSHTRRLDLLYLSRSWWRDVPTFCLRCRKMWFFLPRKVQHERFCKGKAFTSLLSLVYYFFSICYFNLLSSFRSWNGCMTQTILCLSTATARITEAHVNANTNYNSPLVSRDNEECVCVKRGGGLLCWILIWKNHWSRRHIQEKLRKWKKVRHFPTKCVFPNGGR